ncbi:hypothetical protein M885DRAFT_512154 [Pelagophyceae sp. CCMP2097]|nr:hypothetical protein M885DRAFT_512154 [Pelagophyceae sp. CCMP2097]
MADADGGEAEAIVFAQSVSLAISLRSARVEATCDVFAWRRGQASLKLHCRLPVLGVRVNGADCNWSLEDPLCSIRDVDRHDADGYETWLRASEIASSFGELDVQLDNDGATPVDLDDFVRDAVEATAPQNEGAQLVVVTIVYTLEDDGRGVAFTWSSSGDATGVHTPAPAALAAPDADGARCWVPCVDDGASRCAWRLRLGMVDLDASKGAPTVAASGVLLREYDAAAGKSTTRWYEYSVDSATARGVGFVVEAAAANVDKRIAQRPGSATLRLGGPEDGGIATAPLTRVESSIDDAPREHELSPRSKGPAVLRCFGADVGRVELLATELADAAQFWRSWFGEPVDAASHAVVIVRGLRTEVASFAGLTLLRGDSSIAAEAHDVAVRAMYASFALAELPLAQPDADEWLLHGTAGYVWLRYVERARGADAIRSALLGLHDAALLSFKPLSRCKAADGADDADEGERDLSCLAEESWDEADRAKAGFAMHMVECRIGGARALREGWRRLRKALARRGSARLDTAAFFRAAADESGAFDAAAFRTQWVDSTKYVGLSFSYTYDAKRHCVVLDVHQTSLELFIGHVQIRVVEADDAWDYTKKLEHRQHKWEFRCHSRFSKNVKDVDSKPLSAQLDASGGDREIGSDDRDVLAASEARQKDGQAPVKRYRAGRKADKEEKKQDVELDAVAVAAAAVDAPSSPPPQKGRSKEAAGSTRVEASDGDDFGSVSREARRENGSPVLWLKMDPQFALLRHLDARQRDPAWVEQLFGDDDAAAQAGACRALGAARHPSLLGARALATCLRATLGAAHAAPVRCEAAAALAAWQKREASKGQRASWYASTQLAKAFDERFRDEAGGLRRAQFGPMQREPLLLKTALAAAFGTLLACDNVPAEIADRVIELVRDHDARPSALSQAPYVAAALAALAEVRDDKLGLGMLPTAAVARGQARRYLEWELSAKEEDVESKGGRADDADVVSAAACAAAIKLASKRPEAHIAAAAGAAPMALDDDDDEPYFEGATSTAQAVENDEDDEQRLVRNILAADASAHAASSQRYAPALRAAALEANFRYSRDPAAATKAAKLAFDAVCKRGDAHRGSLRDRVLGAMLQAQGKATADADDVWDALLSPQLAFDQKSRYALLRIHRAGAGASRVSESRRNVPQELEALEAAIRRRNQSTADRFKRLAAEAVAAPVDATKLKKIKFGAPRRDPKAAAAGARPNSPAPQAVASLQDQLDQLDQSRAF